MAGTDVSTDLSAWLIARIEEDERVAREEKARRSRWQAELDAMHQRGQVPAVIVNEYDNPGMPGDPDRVLADCAAKRRIIGLHRLNEVRPDEPDAQWGCRVCDTGFASCGCVGWNGWPCDTLKLLALPYAGRPGYREEWRPS